MASSASCHRRASCCRLSSCRLSSSCLSWSSWTSCFSSFRLSSSDRCSSGLASCHRASCCPASCCRRTAQTLQARLPPDTSPSTCRSCSSWILRVFRRIYADTLRRTDGMRSWPQSYRPGRGRHYRSHQVAGSRRSAVFDESNWKRHWAEIYRFTHNSEVFQAVTLLRFVFRSISATNLRVTGTSRLWRGAARKIGPAIASSSGRLPCSTSFCMELRMLPGKLLIVEITESGSTLAPSPCATEQASRTQNSSSCSHVASAAISPVVLSVAVVISANGAKNTSLLQSNVCSSSTNWQVKPSFCKSSRVLCIRVRPIEETLSRANGERCRMCPGAVRSDSTIIVAGTMRAAPYRERSIATWSIPLSNGMMALAELPLGSEPNAESSWVAFTAIHSTSTAGTVVVRSTRTLNFPKGLSRCSVSGYRPIASPLTTSVTAAPDFDKEAAISPPTPPGPRIACRMNGDSRHELSLSSTLRRRPTDLEDINIHCGFWARYG